MLAKLRQLVGSLLLIMCLVTSSLFASDVNPRKNLFKFREDICNS